MDLEQICYYRCLSSFVLLQETLVLGGDLNKLEIPYLRNKICRGLEISGAPSEDRGWTMRVDTFVIPLKSASKAGPDM